MDEGAAAYRRFLDGDDSGFVEIVRVYKDGLIFFLNGFVKNLSVAEELAEDTFVKIGVGKPKFSAKSSFKTWLYCVGHNIAVDHIRKQSKTKAVSIEELEQISGDDLPENEYLTAERDKIIHSAMQKLKTEYRQVLWLVYFEGFSDKETAVVMNKSVHGIETLICRARQALKTELTKEGIDSENL